MFFFPKNNHVPRSSRTSYWIPMSISRYKLVHIYSMSAPVRPRTTPYMDGTLNAWTYLQLPLRQWGSGNVYLQMKSKVCRKPYCRNGVVDTFGQYVRISNVHLYSRQIYNYDTVWWWIIRPCSIPHMDSFPIRDLVAMVPSTYLKMSLVRPTRERDTEHILDLHGTGSRFLHQVSNIYDVCICINMNTVIFKHFVVSIFMESFA